MNKNNVSVLLLAAVLIGLLLLFSRTYAFASPPAVETAQEKIDAYIEARMRELDIPGLAVAVVRGDQIEYVRGYGTADDRGSLVTPQTPFLVASFSKSFTALGVMQLVEEGRLRLDAPVQEYLPWFQVPDPDAAAQVTIRYLLHQTSGFSELDGYVKNLDRDASDQALEAGVRRLARSRLNAPPKDALFVKSVIY